MPSNEVDKYALTPAWNVKPNYDLELPSGQVILVRTLTMEDVVDLDLVEAMDTFTGLAEQTVANKGKGKGKKKTQEETEKEFGLTLFGDKDRFKRILGIADKAILVAVVKPEIVAAPEDDADREDGILYVDTIPFGDRLFIFNAVFDGVGGMESFRPVATADVGDVADVAVVPSAALRNAGA